ncbi:MAG: alpha-1,4-glucan--maltose-1-phosphate maltosyltransferase [Dichotomicrobium sp.]
MKFETSSDQDAESLETLHHLAQSRVAIEGVRPEIDCGRFEVKRVVGDELTVEADIFVDGHDKLDAAVLFRRAADAEWSEVRMDFLENDRWRASVPLTENTRYHYTIVAWRDLFATWRDEVEKKRAAGQSVSTETEEGRMLVESAVTAAAHGSKAEQTALSALYSRIRDAPSEADKLDAMLTDKAVDLMSKVAERTHLTHYPKTLTVWVDRPRAAFSAWYEMFPRSQSGDPQRHGTFDDVIARLAYVRDLGFDVLYFPPIHPIGRENRKGRNNALVAGPGDTGSPYAIGSREGGHDAIHPELGTLEDFRRLVKAAEKHGLEIALDFAIQCAPDHPWITEHPEWFDWRPDGTLKHAENPPKKYEDIVNVHFYREALPSLWFALRDVVLFWADEGVRIFRVDNPHTKPYPFWEWLIEEVRARYPETIFLSEAFTRPKVMKRLAKLGFNQSYTYFTWRNTKAELTEYLSELTRGESREYFRPNFFTNTPDINPIPLQTSGRPGYQARLVLAATLACNYGIYNGFELCEGTPIPGREEYLHSEKYEIRAWDWDRPGNIKDDIRLINRLRGEHPALQQFFNLRFYNAWNDQIIYYGKMVDDLSDFLLFAVNLDFFHPQGAHFEVPLWEFGLPDDASIGVEDLITGARFTWTGKVQHMHLDPDVRPYAAWRLLPPGDPR